MAYWLLTRGFKPNIVVLPEGSLVTSQHGGWLPPEGEAYEKAIQKFQYLL
jgi:hypothetical protein